jgi:RNA polymerase sigma factor (sigma-70 family)
MITTKAMNLTEPSDADLVAETLAGSREAFRQIVERHQTLICSLAYGATGSISRSQDMAQDTFLAAWKDLPGLREPGKLRAWLCGIVRNLIYKGHRHSVSDPVANAGPLEDAQDLPAVGAQPCEQTITREEEAILWRSLEKIPATYREPLILFYRQHQSIEQVGAALDLSEDTVKQRLFRGRKLLQEEVRAFVETTLERTAPGREFSSLVLSALPITTGSMAATGATLGAKGAATAKTGFLALWLLPLAPFIGIFAGFLSQLSMVLGGTTGRQRRVKIIQITAFWILTPVFCVAGEYTVAALRQHYSWSDRTNFGARTGFWWFYTMLIATWVTRKYCRATSLHSTPPPGGDRPAAASQPLTPVRMVMNTVGIFLAMFLWVLSLMWDAGDHLAAGLVAVLAAMLGTLHFFRKRNRSGLAAIRAEFGNCALCCAFIVTVINLRLDVWMANRMGVSVAEIHQLYPLWLVPLLSVSVALWIGLLLLLPGSKQPSSVAPQR